MGRLNIRGLLFFMIALQIVGCNNAAEKLDRETKKRPTTETPVPSVLKVSPVDKAADVDVQSNIQVTFSESLAPESVNRITVFLGTFWERNSVPFNVAYDDFTRTVTINPRGALEYGQKYLLVFNDIQSASGKVIETLRFSFSTHRNLLTRAITYSSTTGVETSSTVYTYDEQGNQLREVIYDGSDSSVAVRRYTDYVYDNNGNRIRAVHYTGSGKDTYWFTPDDVRTYFSYFYDSQDTMIRQVYYTGAGDDTQWFNNDDIVANYKSFSYDVQGRKIREVDYTGTGIDGRWFELKDTVGRYIVFFPDGKGAFPMKMYYSGPGLDKDWFTDDDTLTFYSVNVYDDQDNLIRDVVYNTGLDEKILTQDDDVKQYNSTNFDKEGNLTRWVDYNGLVFLGGASTPERAWGPDQIWFTVDDFVDSYYVNIYNEQGKLSIKRRYYTSSFQPDYGAGIDRIWLTQDDVIRSYSTYTYDTNYQLKEITHFFVDVINGNKVIGRDFYN